jgi:formylglycine-generating enzyme required for sulfatase activity
MKKESEMVGKTRSKRLFLFGLVLLLSLLSFLAATESQEKKNVYKSSYALVIGIGNYKNWPLLSKSYEDAALVGKQLQDMGFAVTYLWDIGSNELKDGLKRFFNDKKIDKNSCLFIWYSGYSRTVDGEDFLVPADAPRENKHDFKIETFKVRHFDKLSKNTKAKHVYMVFDCCLSNKVFVDESIISTQISSVASMLKYPVHQYLCSCAAGQEPRKDSSFRDIFIKVLRNEVNANKNGDNYLTAGEIGAFIKKEMSALYGRTFTPQFGRRKDFNKGEFLFSRWNKIPDYYRPYYFKDPSGLKEDSFFPEMSRIPGGYFMMGDLQKSGYPDENPAYVSVSGIAVSCYEITFEEYDYYCDIENKKRKENGKPEIRKPDDNGWGRGKKPVINVSWEDAVDYTVWLSEQTGFTYRLPTEAEWEYFARAGTETDYWWGNEIGRGNAACYGCGAQFGGDTNEKKTATVKSFRSNAFGLYDTVGNVWEWTCSEYTDKYNGKETKCLKRITVGGEVVVLRGGSWDDEPKKCRVSYRKAGYPGERSPFIGFRVVRELK